MLGRCCARVKIFFKNIHRLIYPIEPKNRKINEFLILLWHKKTLLGMLLKTGYFFVRWADGTQSWQLSKDYYEKDGDSLPESVQSFVDDSFVPLTWIVFILKLLRIPLTMLYLKYPKVTKSFFIFELLINSFEAFFIVDNHRYHIQLIYTYMFINYILLEIFTIGKNFLAMLVYICIFVYAQSIFYPAESLFTLI